MTRRSTNTSMWADACALLAQAERLHREFFQVAPAARGGTPAWEAPIDVVEEGPELAIWVALPGVPPESVELRREGAGLRVAGARRLPIASRSAVIRRLEIPHGRFERWVELPPGDWDLVASEALHGCVRIRLRRA